MGYQFKGNFFLERGANLESQAAHTHPKNTQVPPPPREQVRLDGIYYSRLRGTESHNLHAVFLLRI